MQTTDFWVWDAWIWIFKVHQPEKPPAEAPASGFSFERSESSYIYIYYSTILKKVMLINHI